MGWSMDPGPCFVYVLFKVNMFGGFMYIPCDASLITIGSILLEINEWGMVNNLVLHISY